jgi:hypothetical protein
MISDSLYIMMRLELAWILKERRRRRRKKESHRVESDTLVARSICNGRSGRWHERRNGKEALARMPSSSETFFFFLLFFFFFFYS